MSTRLHFRDLLLWRTQLHGIDQLDDPLGFADRHAVIDHDLLLIYSYSPHRIAVLSLLNGAIRWERALDAAPRGLPLCSGSRVIVATEEWVAALSRLNGEVLWQSPQRPLLSPPLVRQQRVFYATRDGYLHCRDLARGRTVWKVSSRRASAATPFHVTAQAHDDLLYIADTVDSVSAHDLTTGRLRWRRSLRGLGTPALLRCGEFLAVAGRRQIHLLDLQSGKAAFVAGAEGYSLLSTFESPGRVAALLREDLPAEGDSTFKFMRLTVGGVAPRKAVVRDSFSHGPWKYDAFSRTLLGTAQDRLYVRDARSFRVRCEVDLDVRQSLPEFLIPVTDGSYLVTAERCGAVLALRHPMTYLRSAR